MGAVFEIFRWLPGGLRGLFIGAVSVFVLYALYKIVAAIIHLITDIIPGW